MSEPTPRDVVLAFLARMRELTGCVGAQMAERSGGADIAALHRAVIQRRAPRKWQLADGTHYAVHGFGCRITDRDGVEIDVDIAPDGHALMFDGWRVHNYAASIRRRGHDREAISEALSELADEGLLRRVDAHTGFYTTTSSAAP